MSEIPEFITIIDNRGQERRQRVSSVVSDVRGEQVYVTDEGLKYVTDSLQTKDQKYLIGLIPHIAGILAQPEIVVWDYATPNDTLLYYKHLFVPEEHRHRLFVAVVKSRRGIKFLYNFHLQTSGKVKGHEQKTKPEIWYISPQKRKRQFGF
ncbi:MAG: hypothetical protein KGJ80_01425 [Chloroflexota bacterium]|nr:hypothetical protein [Chloroflexota bacterium]